MGDRKEMKHQKHTPQQFITLKVKSFAILREIIGKDQVTLQLPRKKDDDDDESTTVADVRKRILELYPEISAQKIPVGIAVNSKIVHDKSIINDFDEIALLPPISGG